MKREDFEQKGWKFSSEFDNEMRFGKGDVWKDDGQGAFLYIKTKKTEYEMDSKNHSFNTYNNEVNLNFSTNCPAAFCQTRVMG
jgi:hypothetical protein